MSTCVFYIDEAGNTERFSFPIQTGQTAIFCLFALALPLSDWRDFDRDYMRLKLDFFKDEIDQSKYRAAQWEIKGNELCSPRNRNSKRRHAFLQRVFDLCERYDATTFGVTFLKGQANLQSPDACYAMGFQYLAEVLDIYIAESEIYDYGIQIADARVEKKNTKVAASYLSYVFGNDKGRSLTHLIEAPLFADSRQTSGLQIVDNIAAAYFANHYDYYCRNLPGAPDYSHISGQYWPRLRSLEFKGRKEYYDHIRYGYKICDHRDYPLQGSLLQTEDAE